MRALARHFRREDSGHLGITTSAGAALTLTISRLVLLLADEAFVRGPDLDHPAIDAEVFY